MPLRDGDPGVFICGPADIAPWELDDPADAVPPVPGPARAASRLSPGGHRWLVLELCPHCSPAHGGYYCRDHNDRNWWLTHWGR